MQVGRAQFFQIGRSDYNNSPRKSVGCEQSADQSAHVRKRMLSESRLTQQGSQSGDVPKVFQGTLRTGSVDDSLSYAQSVRAGRTKAKETSLKLKKLRYDFKSISTQIMRSKTSVSARQAAGKARREVIRLKRMRQNGEYDEEELQGAIAHAQAMERVAKKKVRHLQEEELMKTGGPCLGEMEEQEETEEESSGRAVSAEEVREYPEEAGQEFGFSGEFMQDQMSQYRELMETMAEELQALASMGAENAMGGLMSDMMDDMWEAMKDMMEDLGLDDLAEGMVGGVAHEMDPADLKMMKIKHRTKEMKALAEADSEYLKALFAKLQRDKSSSTAAVTGGGSFNPQGSGMQLPGATSGAAAAAPMAAAALMAAPEGFSGGIDISI